MIITKMDQRNSATSWDAMAETCPKPCAKDNETRSWQQTFS